MVKKKLNLLDVAIIGGLIMLGFLLDPTDVFDFGLPIIEFALAIAYYGLRSGKLSALIRSKRAAVTRSEHLIYFLMSIFFIWFYNAYIVDWVPPADPFQRLYWTLGVGGLAYFLTFIVIWNIRRRAQ